MHGGNQGGLSKGGRAELRLEGLLARWTKQRVLSLDSGSSKSKERICIRGTRNNLEELEHIRWSGCNDGVGTLGWLRGDARCESFYTTQRCLDFILREMGKYEGF